MKIKRKFRCDCNGRRLKIGDSVRVCAVPDLRGMSAEALKESMPVFRYAVNRTVTVDRFDDYGCAGIEILIPIGRDKGRHALYIETYLLKKVGNSGQRKSCYG